METIARRERCPTSTRSSPQAEAAPCSQAACQRPDPARRPLYSCTGIADDRRKGARKKTKMSNIFVLFEFWNCVRVEQTIMEAFSTMIQKKASQIKTSGSFSVWEGSVCEKHLDKCKMQNIQHPSFLSWKSFSNKTQKANIIAFWGGFLPKISGGCAGLQTTAYFLKVTVSTACRHCIAVCVSETSVHRYLHESLTTSPARHLLRDKAICEGKTSWLERRSLSMHVSVLPCCKHVIFALSARVVCWCMFMSGGPWNRWDFLKELFL